MKIRYTLWCCFVSFLLNAIECSHNKTQTEINELIESDGANDTDYGTSKSETTLFQSSTSNITKEEGIFQLLKYKRISFIF